MNLHPLIRAALLPFAPANSAIHDDDEPCICPQCAGSGEGYTDGINCRVCKGKGEITQQGETA